MESHDISHDMAVSDDAFSGDTFNLDRKIAQLHISLEVSSFSQLFLLY